MKLKLTDKEVIRLIELSKKVLMHYNIKVEDVGTAKLKSILMKVLKDLY